MVVESIYLSSVNRAYVYGDMLVDGLYLNMNTNIMWSPTTILRWFYLYEFLTGTMCTPCKRSDALSKSFP